MRLHAIVDVDASTRAGLIPLEVARAFLHGGARFLQLRAKTLGSRAFLELADACVALARASSASIIINDRIDIARVSRADGVHVGQDDVPPAAARQLLGDKAIVGLSTHTLAQVDAALREPISYLAVGPVFGTGSKETGYEAVGLTLVSAAARLAGKVPVVAIGSITIENASSVLEAGAASVAVISDLLAGGQPEQRTRAFMRTLMDNRV
ncbi:MAG: thiamine phosphate synthase [Acidobacteria bacterium]|nr:MAG: thiamine phosphate synthase [Acidobacteriota bacterium]PYR78614.1 MAG: thiamine phosphate synthase [Acidobacteriota bacterium]